MTAEDTDEETPCSPPSHERVVRRLLVLAATAARGLLETGDMNQQGLEGTRQSFVRWVEELGLQAEMEPAELGFLHAPLSVSDRRTIINSCWRLEGLVMLAREPTQWHVLFGRALRPGLPARAHMTTELPLGVLPNRADFLVDLSRCRPGARGRRLRGLWGRGAKVVVLSLKTPPRPLRQGGLVQLLSYGADYHVENLATIPRCEDLLLALIVPSRTPTLDLELARFQWRLKPLGSGYYAAAGGPYPTIIVFLDAVSEAEHDDLLRFFGNRKIEREETVHWLQRQGVTGRGAKMSKREGADEVTTKFLQSLPSAKLEVIMKGLSPEERLRGLQPEERLLGLLPEEAILMNPDAVLRQLPASYLRTLPPKIRRQIAKRVAVKTKAKSARRSSAVEGR